MSLGVLVQQDLFVPRSYLCGNHVKLVRTIPTPSGFGTSLSHIPILGRFLYINEVWKRVGDFFPGGIGAMWYVDQEANYISTTVCLRSVSRS